MIYGCTYAGAYQMRMEDRIGSLQVGKLADPVLLERSPFTTPKEDLQEIEILLTMLDGRIVYQAGTSASG